MIDLHSHILYGIDDGPKERQQSMDMISAALDAGFTHVVATPHYIHGTDFVSQVAHNQRILDELQIRKSIPKLYLGSEIFYDHQATKHLEEDRVTGINKSRYVLVEVPRENMNFSSLLNYVFELEIAGYQVILAHAERYDFIQQDPNHLASLIKRDVLIQMNLCSLVGRYGKTVEKTAKTILDYHMVHILATDAHRTKDYQECGQAMDKVKSMVGDQKFEELIMENPSHVLSNRIFYPEAPTKVKKNPLLRWIKK